MTLSQGKRLGPYEIVSALGAGGMGEVYHARDVRLERSVAIKALPHEFADDPARLARFEREARLLASLNHPNIAAIYGLEDVDHSTYLVLEFVEGETLAARLARGPLTVRETLETGAQIASAMEAAHDRGVIHRDLKPANVMITGSGVVKVLDFGLARGDSETSPSPAHVSQSPTVALPVTGEGLVLGTAPYMSPEQARGKNVDRRTDVWSFGCVLFECLSGRQVFEGETVSDLIAGILEREPDWSALPASVPVRLADLIGRCLTKDSGDRPRDMGDLRGELNAIAQQLSSPSGLSRSAAQDAPSLAVLYFENLAHDKDSEYFCSGITEDILTDLSKIKGLKVASRNAVFRYRDTNTELAKIAAELGVRSILQGTVRRSGDRVRITAQLVSARDGFQLWAERFDRRLDDVFAVQEEIASSIAGALRVTLTPAEAENLVQNRPSNATAYDLYLKGREYYQQYRDESIYKALELFRKAIEIDPEYALAWAGVADCYGQMRQWEPPGNAPETTRLGLEAAEKAIALNPRLAEAYKAKALVLKFADDPQGERAALAKAIEVNPRYLPALGNMAIAELALANLAGSERLFRRVLEIDPRHAPSLAWLTLPLKLTDRDDEVIASADLLANASEDPLDASEAYEVRGWVQFKRGDMPAVEACIRKGLTLGADPLGLRILEALLWARTGRADEARQRIAELEKSPGAGISTLIVAAMAAVSVGDLDDAEKYLSRTAIRDLSPVVIRLERALHPLLDRTTFAPRRWDTTLVWPLEAQMIDPARFALFGEVRIQSGKPAGSEIDGIGSRS